jgi:hypothetical protein
MGSVKGIKKLWNAPGESYLEEISDRGSTHKRIALIGDNQVKNSALSVKP